MYRSFVSVVDAFENEPDRLGVRFVSKVGYYWVDARNEELVEALRRSLSIGFAVEITFDPASLEIADVIR